MVNAHDDLRPLTVSQCEQLRRQGCRIDVPDRVRLHPGQELDCFWSVHFAGPVEIALQRGPVTLSDGRQVSCQISHCRLDRVRILGPVRIHAVSGGIYGYDIAPAVVIEDSGSIECVGPSRFGQGCRVGVLNEAGGREVPMYSELDAVTAYLLTAWRHREEFQERLAGLIERYAAAMESDIGWIGAGAEIIGCREIRQVWIGPGARVRQAVCLENGTIASIPQAPAVVGPGVIARDFIIAAGAAVSDQALLEGCFVGQGARVGHQFTAEQSLIFANSELLRGEACSAFCGPFTVSHHKSSLLIGGMFSFYNAGSGTNQSNHLYKLGPTQQGVCERGCKNASGSYLMWPARIGAFTMIMGRHYSNCDTADLPFSYLIEQKCPDGQIASGSRLIPAIALRGCGLVRDDAKWARRDRRDGLDDSQRLDRYYPGVLSPYTIEKIRRAMDLLARLAAGGSGPYLSYDRVWIDRKSLESGLETYRQVLVVWLCELLLEHLGAGGDVNAALIDGCDGDPPDRWLDLAGLVVPCRQVEQLVGQVEQGNTAAGEDPVAALADLRAAIVELERGGAAATWRWGRKLLADYLEKDLSGVTNQDIIGLLQEGLQARAELTGQRLADARKEFEPRFQVSYGLDHSDRAAADFRAVRGEFDRHAFTAALEQAHQQFQQAVRDLIGRLERAD